MSRGTLIQLNAVGAADLHLLCRDGVTDVHSYDLAGSLNSWFVDAHDGFLRDTRACQPPVLHGVPLPFSAARDKAATRIQMAWKRANENPRYRVCRRRLMIEYGQLLGEEGRVDGSNTDCHMASMVHALTMHEWFDGASCASASSRAW